MQGKHLTLEYLTKQDKVLCKVGREAPKQAKEKFWRVVVAATTDPSSMKGIFVGYNNSSKAYRIYMKDGNHIEVSHDVIFDEIIAFKKSKEISIDSDDEELLIFEEEVDKEKNHTMKKKGLVNLFNLWSFHKQGKYLIG